MKRQTEEQKLFFRCLELLRTCFIDKAYHFNDFNLYLSDTIDDAHYNEINNIHAASGDEIDAIKKKFIGLNFKTEHNVAMGFLSSKDYGGNYSDPYFDTAAAECEPLDRSVWMTAGVGDIDKTKKCREPVAITRSWDIENILGTYKASFMGENSEYSETLKGDYYEAYKKSFNHNRKGMEVYHYLATALADGTNAKTGKSWNEGQFVGIVDALTDGKICYIVNIGVIPAFGGQGLASELMSFIAGKMAGIGVTEFILDTEKDSALESMYKHFGFRVRFETLNILIWD
jgi:ribosomal protein S18 acetylase RimI-like enzyme